MKCEILFFALGGATEAILIDAFYRGFNVICPYEWLFFVNNKDECWMPESLALEGQLSSQIADARDCIITSSGTNSVLTGGSSAFPRITQVKLRYQEFTLSAAEKMNRLKMYTTPEGQITHFLDQEEQLGTIFTGQQVPGSGRAYYLPGNNNLASQPIITLRVPLSNYRMDMAEILFLVRRRSNTKIEVAGPAGYPDESANLSLGYSGSPAESNVVTPSLIYAPGGTLVPIGTMIDIVSYKLQASGKDIIADTTRLYNVSTLRKNYHPDAQAADPIITIPFALFPEDTKNATGHQAASVLGQLELVIQVRDPSTAITYQVDAWSHSHNVMQSRAGGIGKALH